MRNASIDTFRFSLMLCVIAEHISMDGSGHGADYFGIVLTEFLNFTVAFFFIIAGYFFYKHASSDSSNAFRYMIKYSSRIIVIYIFWYIVYLFLPLISPDTWGNIVQNGFSVTMHDWYAQYIDEASKRFVDYTIYGGYGYHLWFFHALLLAIVILAISIKYNLLYYGFALSIILYTMGLLIVPYKESFLGIPLDIDTRNGPFFSTIFVFIGALLYKHKVTCSLRTALFTAAAGFVMVILEVYIIRKHYGFYRDYYDILIGTIPYATGVALIPICTKNIGVKFNINSLAKYSIGIYLVHLLVMKSLIAIGIWPNFAIIQIIFVLIGCIIFLRLLFMVPPLRRFVS